MNWRICLIVSVIVYLGLALTAYGQIYRWDNGQVISGTEGITPGAGVQLDHRELSYAELSFQDLTDSRFDSSNLSNAQLNSSTLTQANLSGANLTSANLSSSTLSNANLTGALVTGAKFVGTTWRGFTLAQLQSTFSYQSNDLRGINLCSNNLTGWDLHGQDLSRAIISINGLGGCAYSNLTAIDLRGANLTGANLGGSTLSNANLTGALVSEASFDETTSRGFTQAQLASTASYQAKNLQGIRLNHNDLTGWDFSGQNLISASLGGSTTLSNANLTGADARGALGANLTGAILRNTILSDGQMNGLKLAAGESLVIRDEDGVPDPPTQWWLQPRSPIPVTIQQQLTMASGGVLQLLLEADPWDSKISFQPRIPVQLGGTLELTFTDDLQLATQSGRTIKVFDWTGVNPQGQFTVAPQLGTAWDTSKLYTTGEVTLLGISSDLDTDKDVDSNDMLLFLGNWTGTDYPAKDKTWHDGDADFDGDVDSYDLLTFLGQWTGVAAEPVVGSVPMVAAATAAVPEPSSVAVAGIMAALIGSRYRRRR